MRSNKTSRDGVSQPPDSRNQVIAWSDDSLGSHLCAASGLCTSSGISLRSGSRVLPDAALPLAVRVPRRIPRGGFSLIELLVSASIVVLLVTLLTPAVSTCREVARRTQCKNRMRQLSVALHNYNHLHGVLPPGSVNPDGPIVTQEQGYHMNWLVQVLPFMDEEACYQQIDFQKSVYADANRAVRQRRLPQLICPADSLVNQTLPGSSYVGSTGGLDEPVSEDNTGLLFLNSSIRFSEIRDGASYTILLGERLAADSPTAVDPGWMSGTSATLRHTTMATGQSSKIPLPQQTGGFGAAHRAMHVALADGAVKAMNGGSAVWRELGCREDGSMHPGF